MDVQKIREINIPVLLLEGEKSPRMFYLLLDRLEQLIPDTKRVIVPGASHISHEDNPEFYKKTVLEFMESH